jgi:hypothetical protein
LRFFAALLVAILAQRRQVKLLESKIVVLSGEIEDLNGEIEKLKVPKAPASGSWMWDKERRTTLDQPAQISGGVRDRFDTQRPY